MGKSRSFWTQPLTIGFIGLPVALAFARSGHIVYGTARNAKGARQLAIHEIVPVVTPASAGHGASIWAKLAEECDVGEYFCLIDLDLTQSDRHDPLV